MAPASGSNPAPGTQKGDKAKDNRKASADSEIEKKKKLEEQLRESKGEVQKKSDRIKILEAELEAINAEVKKLKREKESITRKATIKEKIVQGRQLDVAFLVHVDASIRGKGVQTMKQHISFIQTIVDRMASENKKQGWKLRIAFAPYRDYKYHKSVKFDAEPCDFTHRFTEPNNLLRRALSRVGAYDSDRSLTQAYFGGKFKFEEYLAIFDWKATNRVVIHITDDKYPPQHSMRKQDVKKALGGSLEIVDKKFKELESMSKAVVLKPLTKPLLPPITKYLPEDIDKQRLPIGKSGQPNQIQCQSYFEHKWYPELKDLITTIKENKDLLYMKGREKVQVQIAKKPFEDDHEAMWPYFARVTVLGEAPKDVVAYRFKTPVENDHSLPSFIKDWHKGDHYLARMEVHSVAARMAAAFNEITEQHKIRTKLEVPKVTTLSIGSGENTKFYNVVEDPKGSQNTTHQHDDILQAFTHWTHHISGTLLMIQINPQGVEIRKNLQTQDVYLRFSDPVIHCSDVMRFLTHKHIDTHTNLGSEGFKLFSASHDCNKVCKELGLTQLS